MYPKARNIYDGTPLHFVQGAVVGGRDDTELACVSARSAPEIWLRLPLEFLFLIFAAATWEPGWFQHKAPESPTYGAH